MQVHLIFKHERGNDDEKSKRCNGGALEDQVIDPSMYSAQYLDRKTPSGWFIYGCTLYNL